MLFDGNVLDYDTEEKDLDIDLIDEVVTFAEESERYFQGHYMSGGQEALCPVGITSPHEAAEKFKNECGSTGCIAGWGAIFAGWCQTRFAFMSYGEMESSPSEMVANPSNGDVISMHAAARYEMGLSERQANAMFDGTNTLSDIRKMVEALRLDSNAELGPLMTKPWRIFDD